MDSTRVAARWRALGPEIPRWTAALLFALTLAVAVLPVLDAVAEAPPLAIVPYAVQVTKTPNPDARVVGDIPADT
jgi:hypothetical protein